MPVMTRIITDARGSSSSVRSIENASDLIQLNPVWAIARSSAGSPTRRTTAATDTANDRTIAPQAIAPATPLLTRRPKLALSRNPTSGNSGISSSMRSPLQTRERVGIERLAMAEQADHDGESDRGFSGGDGHDEEHDDLPVGGAERTAERDEAEVHRVQHDLDRQENRDHVAPHEHTGGADGEQNRRQDQIIVQPRRHGFDVSLLARSTAPTLATRIRSEGTSNGDA